MLQNHFLKVVMYILQCNPVWFWSGLVDSLSFLLLIFNLWLTFQKIWSKWGKNKLILNHFLKVVMYIRNAILWFLSGLVDSPIIPVTNFQFQD